MRSKAVIPADAAAVDQAAAGETYESRFEVGDRLSEVGAESVRAVAEGLLREQRDHVPRDAAPFAGQQDQARVVDRPGRRQPGTEPPVSRSANAV
ncbi:MAG: hypothetical protein A2V70_11200 [Planctomycetes bacterium RBG_13_63_9]|nr:MAG: hypothetical protein A2V70_11200 [Planctomycetes bacterium RBG_13_63_9]